VELSGFGGYAFRSDPDDFSLSDGMRWGIGAAFGARANLRFTTELHGEIPVSESVLARSGALTGTDGSRSPVLSALDSRVNLAAGITWQHASGMSLGVGLNYRFGIDNRQEIAPRAERTSGDALGLQIRVGFHGGVRAYVPPAPPRFADAPPVPLAPLAPPAPPPAPPAAVVEAPPPTPPAPVPAPNRQPTVRAECNPCRVMVGRTVTVHATGQDPDGDALIARWSAPSGTIADSHATTTNWRAPGAPGTVALTVTAEDSRGGAASDTVTIEVVPAPVRVLADVQFDLDRSSLRPDAVAVLGAAVKALYDEPALRLHIEGHASEEGSSQYNRVLGEKRARAVRDYLVSNGIDAGRLTLTSYGEERLKYVQEANRALNRRVALIIDETDD
jgi:outer membrane protein OmpA-like peptidoglycan-associated protein